MFEYVLALHIIFIVTWFSGLFYMVRLLIYNAEANEKTEPEKSILQAQYGLMLRRLWYGITWPSAVLTLVFGSWMLYILRHVPLPEWLAIKLCFVALLYLYHFSLQVLIAQQLRGEFRYNSQQLRIWNEVATVFLVAIVMLVVVKDELSALWGLLGLAALVIVLMAAISIYKKLRT